MNVFELRTKYNELLEFTADSEVDYHGRFACECYGLNAAWKANPVPIDIELKRPPKGTIAPVAMSDFCVLRADLADALAPFLPGMLRGRVTFRNFRPPADHPGWVTCFPGSGRGVETYRGPYCRHVRCPWECGSMGGNLVGWARGAIVRRDIGDQLAFFGRVAEAIYVRDTVIEEARLRERFPDLSPYEFPVVDEPLDGEVLPGDPDWDGVFRPTEMPALPDDDDPWIER